jgi:hypothetical protein
MNPDWNKQSKFKIQPKYTTVYISLRTGIIQTVYRLPKGWTTGEWFPAGSGVFPLSSSKPAVGLTQKQENWVKGLKGREREAKYSPSSIIKNP